MLHVLHLVFLTHLYVPTHRQKPIDLLTMSVIILTMSVITNFRMIKSSIIFGKTVFVTKTYEKELLPNFVQNCEWGVILWQSCAKGLFSGFSNFIEICNQAWFGRNSRILFFFNGKDKDTKKTTNELKAPKRINTVSEYSFIVLETKYNKKSLETFYG